MRTARFAISLSPASRQNKLRPNEGIEIKAFPSRSVRHSFPALLDRALPSKLGACAILQDHIKNEVAVRSIAGSVVL
jgi:hypothetical protein